MRLAYTASTNRATNAIARVFSAEGEATVFINQQKTPPEDDLWISLGKYRFEKDGQAFVLVTNEQTDGHVVVDAVQFLSLDNVATVVGPAIAGNAQTKSDAKPPGTEPATKTDAKLAKQLKELESQKKKLESDLAERPRFLTIVEKSPVDIPIHIRGDVHNLGEVVPRGFLTAFLNDSKTTIPSDSSGRVELARWLSSAKNPLTARVYANRVWSWLMGQGIVPSINNFGTTGVPPTHPELLDWLANELIQSGWSTKHLVRIIVMSDAYRRKVTRPSELEDALAPQPLAVLKRNLSGFGLCFLIDDGFREFGESFVGSRFLVERSLQKRRRVFYSEFVRPSPQGAVARHFIVLDGLRSR